MSRRRSPCPGRASFRRCPACGDAGTGGGKLERHTANIRGERVTQLELDPRQTGSGAHEPGDGLEGFVDPGGGGVGAERGLAAEEEQQPAEGVSDHEEKQRYLAGDGLPRREEPDCPVVCGDHCDDVAGHDGNYLDQGDRAG